MIRATFITYALASVLCVFAPTLTVFVVGRLLQGAANAMRQLNAAATPPANGAAAPPIA